MRALRILVGSIVIAALPSSLFAVSCGTVAAPTACMITNGGFTYTASGFTFASTDFLASGVAIDIVADGPTGAKLNFTGSWFAISGIDLSTGLSVTVSKSLGVNYTVGVTGGSLKLPYATTLAANAVLSTATLTTTANAGAACVATAVTPTGACMLPAAAASAAVVQSLALSALGSAVETGSVQASAFSSAFDATAPPAPAVPFLVRYVSNLAVGDSVVNLTNTGQASMNDNLMNTATGFQQDGQICANIYAYSPDEQMVSCCSCNVTANGLNSLSAKNDLASNTLTPIIPSALVIKIVPTVGGTSCTATSAATISKAAMAPGLLAWGTTIHALPVTPGSPATTYGVTETVFLAGTLSDAELSRMKSLCAFIRANGSGYGICKSCKVGGLGASIR